MADSAGKTLRLRLVTPERAVLERDVRSVSFMGEDGSYGVLANHAPLMTSTVPGVVTVVDPDGSKQELLISDGFAEVRENVLSLVCEEGEHVEDIDLDAAVAAEKAAREKIDSMEKVDPSLPKAEAALRYALLQQMFARRKTGTGHV